MPHKFKAQDLTRSAQLAMTPIPKEWPYADKIYLLAHIQANNQTGVSINIPADAPSMVLSADIRDQMGLNVPTVQEVMDGVIDKKYLVTMGAGVFLRFGDQLAVFDRGGKTKFKPYHLNQPTGRLQSGPAHTAMCELNEELHIFQRINDQLVPLLFTFNSASGLSVSEKEFHLKKLHDHQAAQGNPINISAQMNCISLNAVEEDQKFTRDITYSVEGRIMESGHRMIPSYNADVHSFEFIQSLAVPEEIATSDLYLLSGEPLGREVLLKNLKDLDAEKLAPSLEAYHEMKSLGYNPQIDRFNALMLRPT